MLLLKTKDGAGKSDFNKSPGSLIVSLHASIHMQQRKYLICPGLHSIIPHLRDKTKIMLQDMIKMCLCVRESVYKCVFLAD